MRAALFSSSFPDIKPLEQLTFELKAKQMISDEVEEEDLDELDPKEFKSEDSDEDEGDVYEVADRLGILGNVNEDKKQAELCETPKPLKKANKDDKINEHETVDEKLQLGSLYITLQQMRRAAKLNLSAIDRILKLVKENPSIAFLKKIIKPMCEQVPEDPLNSVINMIHIPTNAVPGTTKYSVAEVEAKKVIPIKILQNGKFVHKCPMCDKVMVSWDGINSHIRLDHFNQVYSCPYCSKQCKSLDGMRRHITICKTDIS